MTIRNEYVFGDVASKGVMANIFYEPVAYKYVTEAVRKCINKTVKDIHFAHFWFDNL